MLKCRRVSGHPDKRVAAGRQTAVDLYLPPVIDRQPGLPCKVRYFEPGGDQAGFKGQVRSVTQGECLLADLCNLRMGRDLHTQLFQSSGEMFPPLWMEWGERILTGDQLNLQPRIPFSQLRCAFQLCQTTTHQRHLGAPF